MNKKGFTLIELLVVIAIIAILSSIAFFQFSSARNKGNNAKIQSEIQQIKTEIELTTNGGTYPAASPTPIPARFVAPACGGPYTYQTDGTGSGYLISSKLCGTPVQYFCVDSSGESTTTNANPIGSTTDISCL